MAFLIPAAVVGGLYVLLLNETVHNAQKIRNTPRSREGQSYIKFCTSNHSLWGFLLRDNFRYPLPSCWTECARRFHGSLQRAEGKGYPLPDLGGASGLRGSAPPHRSISELVDEHPIPRRHRAPAVLEAARRWHDRCFLTSAMAGPYGGLWLLPFQCLRDTLLPRSPIISRRRRRGDIHRREASPDPLQVDGIGEVAAINHAFVLLGRCI